jgi:membrane peptidoglycan carboxypeptidase
MVQPVLGPNDREPDLLTHHEHNGSSPNDFDYDDEHTGEQHGYNDYRPDDDGDEPGTDEDGKKKKPVLTPKQRKKRRWRRIRRTLYVLFGLFFVLPAIAFVIMYFNVSVPTPESVAAKQSQPISYFYADGSLMAKELPPAALGGGGNRVPLKVGEVTDAVKHASYAAEDATFETNSGFDVTGILRAVYNQLTGGTGGGSTISQQYIKKATENDAPTLTRKATELVKSFKMNNEQSKEEIITAYLNTIYFGRGASGVQAAAQAYFKKDAKALSPSESALLAGMIQGPSRFKDMTYMTKRWNYVMDQMVSHNWITQAYRDSTTFPTPVPYDDGQSNGTPNYFVQQRVKAELDALGFPEDKLFSGGYKVYTTIDPKAQKAAEQAVADGMKGQTDPQILNALVAVDPKTGGVKAYYGGPTIVKGPDGKDQLGQDHADQARNPGSSIKPFDLTAFLKLGKGLGETFDGTSPRTFPGVAKPIKNAGDSASCGPQCTVAKAMEISANTVFYDMVLNVTKPLGVAQAAQDAGIKMAPDGKSVMGNDNNISIGGGSTVATPEDMAAGYATFAADGIRHDQHFVAKLTNSSDEVAYENQDPNTPAFDPNADKSKQIAGNVTQALQPVIAHSNLKCPTGHECAGKTGTQQYQAGASDKASLANYNAQTWMVGYTPSISAAVWVGGDGNKALKDMKGNPIFGATLAGPIWQNFMSLYLNGQPSEKFPTVSPIGKDANATPTPTSTAKQDPTTTTQTPTSTQTTTTTPTTSDTPTTTKTKGRPSTTPSLLPPLIGQQPGQPQQTPTGPGG